jgi:hypothetical protein
MRSNHADPPAGPFYVYTLAVSCANRTPPRSNLARKRDRLKRPRQYNNNNNMCTVLHTHCTRTARERHTTYSQSLYSSSVRQRGAPCTRSYFYFVLWSVENSVCSVAVGYVFRVVYLLYVYHGLLYCCYYVVILYYIYIYQNQTYTTTLLFFNLIRSDSLCVYIKHK